MKLSHEEEKNNRFFSSDFQQNYYFNKTGLMYPEQYLFDKYIDNSKNVLDLGCGAGRTTAYISQITLNVIGVDINDKLVTLAKQKMPKTDFRVMNACSLEFPDNVFDVIVFSYNGIDYIYPEEKRILAYKEIYRVLKKDGIFIYSTHNKVSPFTSLNTLFGLPLSIFTLKILTSYRYSLHKNGFLLGHVSSEKKELQWLRVFGYKVIEILPQKTKINYWNHYVIEK